MKIDESDSPSTTFSATVKVETSRKCWCTMPIPALSASRGELNSTFAPATSTVPSSGRYKPVRMFERVDLPAPFSPRRACTSPKLISRFTWSFATTPGNLLTIPVILMADSSPMSFLPRGPLRRWTNTTLDEKGGGPYSPPPSGIT